MKERPILFSGAMVRALLAGTKTQTRRVLNPQPFLAGDHWAIKGYERGQEVLSCPFDPTEYAQCAYGAWAARLGCPCGQPGDRLWVRESFQALFADGVEDHYQTDYKTGKGYRIYYMATDARQEFVDAEDELSDAVTPSIFMPRWASRITLELTGVRVERLQDISESDAIAEGLLAQKGDGLGPGSGFKWVGIGYHGAGFTARGERTYHTPIERGCSCRVGRPTPAHCAYLELWDSINAKRAPWSSNPWVWCISFRIVRVDRMNQ